MTDWTDAQRATIEGVSTGLRMNTGAPCECGPEHYTTRSVRKYSDTMLYKHTCGNCGNYFESWTEG